MKRYNRIWFLLAAVLLLTGCSMRTVEQMYRLPKRSEDFSDLQIVIDQAMAGLEYCAPLSGENQQTVQMADLNGDGDQEYLVFAKGGSELPLKILIFDRVDGEFCHIDSISSNGFAFDQVEYIQMDKRLGVELVVGCQLNDQVLRSMSVYSFASGITEQIMSSGYTKFLTVDMEQDGVTELFVLHPGQSETDKGVVVLYSMVTGVMERSNEVQMSEPADQLKRILVGRLYDGETAVFVGSTVDDTALITDIYTNVNGKLTNVSVSNESGTSIKTMRNHYVYSEDIDGDYIIELPQLISMASAGSEAEAEQQGLIRWYSMKIDGTEINKMYTYHNFVSGWYLELEEQLSSSIVVEATSNVYTFFLSDADGIKQDKLFTIYALSGQNRDASLDEKIVLLQTDTVTYAATLEENAANYQITQQSLIKDFHLIRQNWKTGET
ncbi:MAG: hypothetical protein IJB47_06665 [Oscillospiraceae bacterium]|nr:hypothetical protein [Oscillospiraceae bacterium]